MPLGNSMPIQVSYCYVALILLDMYLSLLQYFTVHDYVSYILWIDKLEYTS